MRKRLDANRPHTIEDNGFFNKKITDADIIRKNIRLKIVDKWQHLYGKYVFLWEIKTFESAYNNVKNGYYIVYNEYIEYLVMTDDFQRCCVSQDEVEQSVL